MSHQDMQEVEVKLYTPDLSLITDALASIGATLIKPRLYEHNLRYENDVQSFTQNGIVLRLREDNTIRLTYKADKTMIDGISKRFEAEVEVSDFNTMDTILQRLGFTHAMIYEKYRTTYQYEDAEIVLDEMPYGNFTEIEGDINTIENLIVKLDLVSTRRIPYSYTQIFDLLKRRHHLNFRDLTFDNFDDIKIDLLEAL